MADINWIATVPGVAFLAALETGTLKIPPENFNVELGNVTGYTPAVDSNGDATQTDMVTVSNQRISADSVVATFGGNKWNFNSRFAPRQTGVDYTVTEIGLWVYATISGNTVALTTPGTGTRTLLAIASKLNDTLFVLSVGFHENVVPIIGALSQLNSQNVVLPSPTTYPLATYDFPGNLYLARTQDIADPPANPRGLHTGNLDVISGGLRVFQNTSTAITASNSAPQIIYVNAVDSSGVLQRATTGSPLLVVSDVAASAKGLGYVSGVFNDLRLHTAGSTPTYAAGDDVRLTATGSFSKSGTPVGVVLSGDTATGLYDVRLNLWVGSGGSGYTDWTPNNGIALTVGTNHTLTIPDSGDLDNFDKWSMALGDTDNGVDFSTGLIPVSEISEQVTGSNYILLSRVISNTYYNGILATIDLTTRAVTKVGTTNLGAKVSSNALAYDYENSVLYGLLNEGSEDLYTINTTTGIASKVGETNTPWGAAMTFYKGRLLLWEGSSLRRISVLSTTTGLITKSYPGNTNYNAVGSLFEYGGRLFATNGTSLIEIDTRTFTVGWDHGYISGMGSGTPTASFVIGDQVYLFTNTERVYLLNMETITATEVGSGALTLPDSMNGIQGGAYSGYAGFRIGDYLIVYRNSTGTEITLVPLRTCHIHEILAWKS